jgi:U3 small nucleolar RNA-associated protein 14
MGQEVRFAKAKPYVSCPAQNLFERVAELRQLREQVRQAEATSQAVAKIDQQGYRKRKDRPHSHNSRGESRP